MANTSNINVRVDACLKLQAEKIFSELGMNLSTALNLFLRSAVRCGGIPFDLRLPVKPRAFGEMSVAEFDTRMEKAFSDAANGKGRPAEEYFSELESRYSL